jgi:hypothetical protein
LTSPVRSAPQVVAEVVEANNGDWAATGGRWQSGISVTIAVIITVIVCATNQR